MQPLRVLGLRKRFDYSKPVLTHAILSVAARFEFSKPSECVGEMRPNTCLMYAFRYLVEIKVREGGETRAWQATLCSADEDRLEPKWPGGYVGDPV